VIRKRPTKRQPKVFIKANQLIRVPEVRVLTEYGEMIGVMSTRDALNRAEQEEKDLVLVTENAKPPICKIIDLAKYKYQLQQKQAEGRKKARNQETKEIRLTPFIGEGDFQTRLKRIIEFLTKGDKVRLSIEFRGREITKREFGDSILQKIFDETKEIAVVEIRPQLLGKKMMAQLMPIKTK